jgi:hypothetical protein
VTDRLGGILSDQPCSRTLLAAHGAMTRLTGVADHLQGESSKAGSLHFADEHGAASFSPPGHFLIGDRPVGSDAEEMAGV